MVRNLRSFGTKVAEVFQNRNPRNLELMTIGYKPNGYHLEKPGKIFWNKLNLRKTSNAITASVEHFDFGTVLTASTSEWPIRKRLYKATDITAYEILARVFADRCLSIGLNRVQNFYEREGSKKIATFLKTLEECGVGLQELKQYEVPRDNEFLISEKVWEFQ